jgi:oligo-1,6-glucosidase/alpha-glucosidase
VRDEVFDMMNWWLERGIDGFRMDVINLISKPDGYPDGDPDSGWVGVEHFAEGPRVHEFLSTMDERVLSQHDGIFTIGETIGVDVPEADRYAADGLDTVFHFDHVTLDFDEFEGWWRVRDWSLPELKDIWGRWQTHPEEAWPSAYLGNHDWPRTVSRWGDDDEYRYESATALGTLVLTSRGTPFVFQGDELGMTNYPFESVDELRDADATNRIEEAIEAGDIEGFDEVRDLVRYRSRDNARTPMQWDGSENAGFTDGEPWINVNPNYEWLNAAADRKAEASIFEHFQRLVDLRHDHDTLVYGEYDDLLPHDDRVWAYLRTRDGDGFLVVLNLSTEETTVELPARARFERSELVVDNYVTATNPEDLARPLTLRPYEARVYRQSD